MLSPLPAGHGGGHKAALKTDCLHQGLQTSVKGLIVNNLGFVSQMSLSQLLCHYIKKAAIDIYKPIRMVVI